MGGAEGRVFFVGEEGEGFETAFHWMIISRRYAVRDLLEKR